MQTNLKLSYFEFSFSLVLDCIVYTAARQKGCGWHRHHSTSTRRPGRGRLEVRAPASVLHGAQSDHREAPARVHAEHVQSDDRHRAVDILMRRSQESQGSREQIFLSKKKSFCTRSLLIRTKNSICLIDKIICSIFLKIGPSCKSSIIFTKFIFHFQHHV